VQVPTGVDAKALEVRLHVYNRFTGTIYWDDLTVEKLDAPDINMVGGFEGDLPSFWTKGHAPAGSTLSWATDESRSMGHSLKIMKDTTADSAAWISDNMCDIWSPQISKNVDIKLGAYVKTEGVNTSPANDDERWYISYAFWDSGGAFIGETKLPIDQSVASSSGWVADTNDIGVTTLPVNAWTLIVKFVGGKDATGTVWADDFLLTGRSDWAGQDWNTQVGVPSGWYFWLPPIGGNDGDLNCGYENTKVTKEAAHSGLSSLKFDLPFDRQQHDGFVATHRFMLDQSTLIQLGGKERNIFPTLDVKEGDMIRIGVWIKTSDLVPDSATLYPGTWSVGLTPLWFTGIDNHLGYSPVGPANDYVFAFPAVTQFDWTQYTLDVQVPTGVDAKALEVRLHVYNRFTGTIYWDDLTIKKIGSATGVVDNQGIPATYQLANNYPNPFNPSTNIQYALSQSGQISLVIYNLLGQKVRSLVNSFVSAGYYEVTWDGRDENGQSVQSGVYIFRLQTGTTALVKKMMLIK
jgi:hypothetical protein